MELTKRQQKLIKALAKKYDLRLLLLFGSQVSGKTHKHSDFDVAYLSHKKLDLMEEAAMIVDLFPAVGSRKVDLVNISNASPLLYYGVFKDAQVLHEAEKYLFFNLRLYSFKKFIESQFLYDLKFERLQAKIAAM